MLTRHRVEMAMLFSLCVSSALIAQRTPPAITAAAAGANVRFTSPGNVCQIRVQIFSPAGDAVFDSAWKDGNVLDWPGESAGQPLASGSYHCRAMVKDLEGQVSEKEATIVVEGGRMSIAGSDENSPKITLLVHDGTNGSIVTTGGDLSFRMGNFLSGKDSERMRLTADGELRVEGVIHANKGIVFDDGTILNTAAGLPGSAESGGVPRRDGIASHSIPPGVLPRTIPPATEAKRFKPRTNFTPAYQFVVGDAGVTVGTTNPAYKLDVAGPINTASQYNIAGSSFAHNYGTQNTFLGFNAGNFTTTGNDNTGSGQTALQSITTGSTNTASGSAALSSDNIGDSNTANGALALFSNQSGSYNTAAGAFSLRYNTVSNFNTATGYAALYNDTAGYNTADGYQALLSNTTGYINTAVGYQALYSNTSARANTAIGSQALYNNTGGYNIAVGIGAGFNLTTGNLNIDIGNNGVAADAAVIRIGDSANQTKTFIAAIRGVTTGSADAVPVLIDSQGQLGTVSSSRRYKFDINSMGDATDGLMRLRPVTFRYLAHGDNAPLQYGLIAEEVDEVYPELVARNKDGEVETVMYQFLAPMLLNEVQKQHRRIEEQQKELETQRKTIETQGAALEAIERRLQSLERQAVQR